MITPDEVRARLLEMGSTLRRIYVPGLWPAGFKSTLPDPIHTREERFAALVDQFAMAQAEIKELRAELEGPDGRLSLVRAPQERVANAAYGLDRPRPETPSSAEISRMDEAMQWPGLIVHRLPKVMYGKRRVIWYKSLGLRTGRVARHLGVTRETVRRWWDDGCAEIAQGLSKKCCTPPGFVAAFRAA